MDGLVVVVLRLPLISCCIMIFFDHSLDPNLLVNKDSLEMGGRVGASELFFIDFGVRVIFY